MKALLEAGVHFGHRTRRWHPKMRTFIFTERNGIHIIDLQQTMRQVNAAYQVVRDTVRGELDRLPKKEALLLRSELVRLNTRIGGLRTMTHLPDLIFIVDVMRE